MGSSYGWRSCVATFWDWKRLFVAPLFYFSLLSSFRLVILEAYTDTLECITDASADLAVQSFPWTEFGLPILSPQDIPSCGINDDQQPCARNGEYFLERLFSSSFSLTYSSFSSIVIINITAPEYFPGFIHRHPVFPPYGTALYSNAAYKILAYVIEAITGKSYQEVLQKDIFQPLGLKHSSSVPPVNSGAGVIPDGDAGWSRPYGDEVA